MVPGASRLAVALPEVWGSGTHRVSVLRRGSDEVEVFSGGVEVHTRVLPAQGYRIAIGRPARLYDRLRVSLVGRMRAIYQPSDIVVVAICPSHN